MARTIKQKHEKIRDKYKDAPSLYMNGKITRKEFINTFNALRKLTQYRYDKMMSLGLDSPPSNDLGAFIFQDTHSRDIIPSITQTSNYGKLYNLMYNFVTSPYSTPEDYKAQNKILEDMLGAVDKWSDGEQYISKHITKKDEINTKQYWINVFMEGHFWRLKKLFGSSTIAMYELDMALEEGLTTDDVIDAINLTYAHAGDFATYVEKIAQERREYNESISKMVNWREE